MRPPLTARALHILRHALLWTVGPAVLILRGRPAELTVPTRCGGALDLLVITAARGWPDLRVGTILAVLQIGALCVALACFSELAARATGHVAAALSITIALGVSQLFPNVLALPCEAAAFAACGICALAAAGPLGRSRSRPGRTTIGCCLALALAASMVPAWSLACAVAAGVLVWRELASVQRQRRIAAAFAAAAILLVLGSFVLRAVDLTQPGGSAWFACVLPGAANLAALQALMTSGAVGSIVLALAALGLWQAAFKWGVKRAALALALLALAVLPGAEGSWRPAVVLAPMLLVVWWAAAVGLWDLIQIMGSGRLVLFAAAAAMVALPVLQWTIARADERDNLVRPLGHADAFARQIRLTLNLVPPGSALVEEDASIDLLLRAVEFGHRTAKPVEIVARNRDAVLAALQKGESVYAFPLGQRELALRGFAFEPVLDPRPTAGAVRGVAKITATRACVDVGPEWVDLSAVGASGRIALSAASEGAEGPIVAYFNGSSAATPYPDGWPPRTRRGFSVRVFARDTSADAARFDAEMDANDLQGHPAFGSPFVVKLQMFRTPLAPRALAVVLGEPRTSGVGRLTANYEGALPLTICDAPDVSVSEF